MKKGSHGWHEGAFAKTSLSLGIISILSSLCVLCPKGQIFFESGRTNFASVGSASAPDEIILDSPLLEKGLC